MNINDNKIAFTSNIRFVAPNKFRHISSHTPNIGFTHDERNIIKANEFCTVDIRTCTGGGLVKPNIEAEGFHLLDDFINLEHFPEIVAKLFRYVKNPERGLLIGSKDLPNNPYSLIQFQKLKKIFVERVKNVSIFEKHRFNSSESHYHYSLETDTWTLSSKYWRYTGKNVKGKSVDSVEELLNAFEHVSIAPGDRLFMGKQEILPQDYPNLFRHN